MDLSQRTDSSSLNHCDSTRLTRILTPFIGPQLRCIAGAPTRSSRRKGAICHQMRFPVTIAAAVYSNAHLQPTSLAVPMTTNIIQHPTELSWMYKLAFDPETSGAPNVTIVKPTNSATPRDPPQKLYLKIIQIRGNR